MTDRVLACVRWSDAHGNAMAVYEAHEVPHAPAMVCTYGIILRQDDTGISLANEVFDAGGFRGVTFIPAGMVTDVSFYHAVRRRRPRPRGDRPAPSPAVVPRRDARAANESVVSPSEDSGPD